MWAREGRQMKRLVVLLAMMGAAVLSAAGAAWAANIVGTEADNNIVGTAEGDTLEGLGGNDTISGMAAQIDGIAGPQPRTDRLRGGAGNDTLYGGDDTHAPFIGNDHIDGEDGDDYAEGGSGADVLNGGPGNDMLVEGPDGDQAPDNIVAGDGADEVSAAGVPASKDTISCGPGTDFVQADSLDEVASDCETVDVFDPDGPADPTIVPEGDYKRNCTTRRFSFVQCGVRFPVYRQDVYVKLRDSELNRRVEFLLLSHSNNGGCGGSCIVSQEVSLVPPQQAFLARQRIGGGPYSIQAASFGPYRLWVQSTVKTRSY